MPRQSKPFFRQQTQSWYCSINGKQFPLGKKKTEAFEKFYELIGKGAELQSIKSTLYDLAQAYLDWCEKNRKPGTYDNHKKYLRSLIDSVGKKLRVGSTSGRWFARNFTQNSQQPELRDVLQNCS